MSDQGVHNMNLLLHWEEHTHLPTQDEIVELEDEEEEEEEEEGDQEG